MKIGINVISGDYKIPIEIKWSDNGDKDRRLFTGILNELVKKLYERFKLWVYIIGVLYKNGDTNVAQKIETVMEHLAKHPELIENIEEYVNKYRIRKINNIDT